MKLIFKILISNFQASNNENDIWPIPIKYVSIFTEKFGKILHDHELIGLENLPNEGPALLIYYHALLPVDYYYVHAKVFLYKNRRIKIVGDRFLFKIPGTIFKIYLKLNLNLVVM